MSNNQVGTVYQQIIQDVVESSRVDFEEGGVDEHVLEELKLVGPSLLFCQLGASMPHLYTLLVLPFS
jgi:transcription initiation factor TFIIA large subunit